ncbi:MAG: UMP kinase [Saccharofermentanales bacterium]|jgi:uridylate kinase|nr:UMP kinase [Eubacteriales bacterium]MDD3610800.1 UMP kinase [Eubacteriales bacterium]HHU04762.1 UMP kinase [Fastidiosipila sp.]
MSKYRRILLKISGEFLAGEKESGIDNDTLLRIAEVLAQLNSEGFEMAVVVGGGNFWRGRDYPKMDRVTADHIGMLGTSMNALALSDALEQKGVATRVMNAVEMPKISESFIRKRAVRHLEKGRVVIFAGGTGNPFFTTDSAAALRASEINADVILKATLVDGVYDKDPKLHADAIMYTSLTYGEVLQRELNVIDATAAALCRDNKMRLIVFNLNDPNNISRIAHGEKIGTLVTNED